MKKFLYSFLFLFIFCLNVAPAFALQIETGEEYLLQESETVDENLYVGAGNVNLNGTVNGDLLSTSGNAVITGNVRDDVWVVGGSVKLLGQVGNDLRVLAGDVFVSEDVNGDIMVLSGVVHIASGVNVAGDVVVGAGQLIIDGNVAGDVLTGAGQLNINGTVAGSVKAYTDRVVFSEQGRVEGDFEYWSQEPQKVTDFVGGEVVYHEGNVNSYSAEFFAGLFSGFAILKVLMFLLAGLVVAMVFKKQTLIVVRESRKSFGNNILKGLGFVIGVPIVSIMLFVSVIGSVLGGLLLSAFAFVMILSKVLGGVLLGSMIFKAFKKTKNLEVTWVSALVGVFLIQVIGFVPVVGWIFASVFVLSVTGAIFSLKYKENFK